ncbi:MAG: NIL domain-containing protein [Candidatus Omnitrophica bacterium]|nr:NIL domain-containing protein [Candidatus Omnitrophota bacterium]
MQTSIGLTFPGHLKDESIICYICKRFEVDVNIIEASFSMSSGWAILGIVGKEDEIERVFRFLTSKGVKINKVGEEK